MIIIPNPPMVSFSHWGMFPSWEPNYMELFANNFKIPVWAI